MNSARRFGYRFIVEPSGPALLPAERKILSELQPAGVMLRKRNFVEGESYERWLAQYRTLINDIRAAVGRAQLLVCIDHEGGRIVRPPAPITRFPYAARWTDRARRVAEAMGAELRSLAVNTLFGPVADIHSNPANPVINQRAFGRTPEEVLSGAIPFADGITASGILSCAKHFPGHGDTHIDSHWGLPLVESTLDELRARELAPFAALVKHGVPLIMTCHVVFTKVDATHTATTSKVLLHDILRRELGFTGTVVADALGMQAIASSVSNEATVRDGLLAGLDLFLMAGDSVSLEHALEVETRISEIHGRKELPAGVFDASKKRIDQLLAGAQCFEVRTLPEKLLAEHAALAKELESRKDWEAFSLSLPGFE